MNIDETIKHLLSDGAVPSTLNHPLPDEIAALVVERLKQEADRHWWINANQSLKLAGLIIEIGQARNDRRQIALGMMARGDALKYLGQRDQAWETLKDAGELFRSDGDEVGWARTCIGRLPISTDLNRVAEALADAEHAREIFVRYHESEKLLRLALNTAVVYGSLGDYWHTLDLYRSAVGIVETLGPTGEGYLGAIYTNMGYAYNFLGDFRQALSYYEHAHHIFAARNETSMAALAELNIAHVAQMQGHYRHALGLLHRVQEVVTGRLPMDAALAGRAMVECYLFLNRYVEARDLSTEVVEAYRALGAEYEVARTLLYLATAEAEIANFPAAQAALDEAEPIFVAIGASAWVAMLHLRRGRIALKQGDLGKAQHDARLAASYFEATDQKANYADAILLDGQASFNCGDLPVASQSANITLKIARVSNLPALRYGAYLLLGRITEAQDQMHHAMRHYRAAAATVDRVQRGLTITLRPGFLEDKGEGLRALIRLHLADNQPARAFQALEQAKSQVLLGYLVHRDNLRWMRDDPRTHALIEELENLRNEHQWLYRLVHEPPAPDKERQTAIAPEQALRDVINCERRMRAISEQLYLYSAENKDPAYVHVPSIDDLKGSLPDNTTMIEFFNDGYQLWAFTLDNTSLAVEPLTIAPSTLDQLIGQLQFNVACALKVGPNSPVARGLSKTLRRICQELYTALIEPIANRFESQQRLVIVPYGILHYLPFHLLHDGTAYLIERYELVILPAAGLVTQRSPKRERGALVLAHSWDGKLPETRTEARLVQNLFGGEAYYDDLADRNTLLTPPSQVLHIAAHGEYRIDQPDLSYIQLADGQVFTDDLLQHDLSYELVTLSACETGQANVTAGDELIGLGRGFLYAGAGALIASLWRVDDNSTVRLMEHLYGALQNGASKAAALRDAQCTMLAGEPALHPAFWGAFQLVGDPDPLSVG